MLDKKLYDDPEFIKRLDKWGKNHVWEEALSIFIKNMVKGSRVLDIACGTGTTLLELIKRGYDAYGCDFSSSLIKMAGKRVGDSRVLIADAHNLPYTPHSFHYSYTIGSIEHFEDTHKAIKECLRVTSVSSFHHIPVADDDKDMGWTTDGVQPYLHLSVKTWDNLFIECGAKEVRIRPSEWKGERTVGKWFIVTH